VSPLLWAETESNVSVFCNPAQVFVDPGETSRVSKLTTAAAVASTYTTSSGSTKYVASDDRAINKGTLCVRHDCEVSIIKGWTNVALCEMKQEVSLQINT